MAVFFPERKHEIKSNTKWLPTKAIHIHCRVLTIPHAILRGEIGLPRCLPLYYKLQTLRKYARKTKMKT